VIAKGALPRIPVLQIHSARLADFLLLAGLMLCGSFLRAQTTPANATLTERIAVSAGMTHLLDLPVNIERVSVAAPETAEAVPVSARSLMINGKAPGETSVVIWLSDGSQENTTST
jgi:pilus assembly protein CpaC